MELADVFGISSRVDSASYVDRGGLDSAFQRALASDRHIAVHGGSKQGKSWLRAKGLPDSETLLVQCTPRSTPATILQEALGRLNVSATLSQSATHSIEGTLDFKGAAELGKLLGKLRAEVGGNVSGNYSATEESAPVGQTPADLLWVALTLRASGRRLVLEDFHYMPEPAQQEFAFMLKALGEYGLRVVIVGVWPRDHLLAYYNGDLDGRVDDIHLHWSDDELDKVVELGTQALNIRFPNEVAARMVRDAYGSVGLLQRLAEQFCIAQRIYRTVPGSYRQWTGSGTNYLDARRIVAAQMQGRFQTFADNFVRGMRRLSSGLEVYRYILETVTEASDAELIAGIDSAELLSRMHSHEGAMSIRASDLTQALECIDKLQLKINVNPPVVTYNRSDRKLFLADRAFLFYRAHGANLWPWSPGEPEIVNDLYMQEPLDLDLDVDGG